MFISILFLLLICCLTLRLRLVLLSDPKSIVNEPLGVFRLLFLPNVSQQRQGQTYGVYLTFCSIFLEVSFLRFIRF